MKARIIADDFFGYKVCISSDEENYWYEEEDFISFNDEEASLILQYQEISKKYNELCKSKKHEQDEQDIRNYS